MFWKYNNTNSNQIETLLNSPDVTLQELMDEENILQECKAQNKKLVDFLCRPENILQLVVYVSVEPPADLDEKTRFTYPNLACELLTCDNPTINEHLVANEPLSKLYAFLEGEPPLNPLLASFFSRTFGVLVARKSEQHWYAYQITCMKVLLFLQTKENCISLFLKHLGTSAIMDLLLKIITQIEGLPLQQLLTKWFEAHKVLPSLIALFRPEIDSDRHSNVSQLLCDVIRTSRGKQNVPQEFPNTEPDPNLIYLEKEETVSELLDHMFSGETKSESGIVGGIAVLLTLIVVPIPKNAATYGDDPLPKEFGDDVSLPSLPPVVSSTTSAILPRLKDFHDLLLNPPQKPPVKTTVGTLDPPLGNTRLQVARLLAALIATNNPAIHQELCNLGTLEVLLDLFFKYQWNNFLHTQVELCIAAALRQKNEAIVEGDQLHCLAENLLVKCELLKRIPNAWEENETNQVREKRRGYMGHLANIANLVEDQIKKCSLRPILAKQLPSEVVSVWDEFVNSRLSEVNEVKGYSLGGLQFEKVETDPEEADDDDDLLFQTNSSLLRIDAHQAFTDYQLQQMAPSFVENYAFHDNEFNDPEDTLHSSVDRLPDMALNEDMDRPYELFKRVCAKELRSLEDAEEKAWEDSILATLQTSDNEASRRKAEKEGPGHSSSDEEEEDEDKDDGEIQRPTKTDVRMDVDVNDIWSSGAATLDTIADFQNPWSSGLPAEPPSDAFVSSDCGWADFSSFETNFNSSTKLNEGKKPHSGSAMMGEDLATKGDSSGFKTEQSTVVNEREMSASDDFESPSETSMKELQIPDSSGSDSEPAAPSLLGADANANPTTHTEDVTSTATAMVDEVAIAAVAAVKNVVADKLELDNQRFLGGSQDKMEASEQKDSEQASPEPADSEDQQEKRETDCSITEGLSSDQTV